MFLYHGHYVELEYREYKLPHEFPCIALLRGQYTFPAAPGSQLTFLHFHNCLEIGICHEGLKEQYIEDYHRLFGTGEVCVIPPYAMHISHNKPEVAADIYEYLYFEPEEILKTFYPSGIPSHLLWYKETLSEYVFSESQAPQIHFLLSSILDELRCRRPFYEYGVRGLLLSLMVEFGRVINRPLRSETGIPTDSRYRNMAAILPALEEIHENWAAAPDIEVLASSCHLSPAQFRRIFKQFLKQTPSSYIRMIQLQKASELLYGTEKSILDIAMETGFLSLSGFNRSFLGFYGVSPGKWRSEKCTVQKKNIKYSPFPL